MDKAKDAQGRYSHVLLEQTVTLPLSEYSDLCRAKGEQLGRVSSGQVDWEERRWEAAVVAMRALIEADDRNDHCLDAREIAHDAIIHADELIAEYRKAEGGGDE